jgi:hypothetical protein
MSRKLPVRSADQELAKGEVATRFPKERATRVAMR